MIKKNLNDETELEWSKQTWQKWQQAMILYKGNNTRIIISFKFQITSHMV